MWNLSSRFSSGRKTVTDSKTKIFMRWNRLSARTEESGERCNFTAPRAPGRWSSQLVQNLPKTNLDLSTLTEVKELVRAGKWKELQSRRPNVPYLLSQMLRTALVPEAGKEFIVADYNAVEPRVLAWLAGEHWRNQLFAQGGDLYCASASRMFHGSDGK